MVIQSTKHGIRTLTELGADFLTCYNCESEVPDTREHNPYYGQKVDSKNVICQACLGYMLNICMNPPQFILSPQGPIRIKDNLILPFSKDSWIILRCK